MKSHLADSAPRMQSLFLCPEISHGGMHCFCVNWCALTSSDFDKPISVASPEEWEETENIFGRILNLGRGLTLLISEGKKQRNKMNAGLPPHCESPATANRELNTMGPSGSAGFLPRKSRDSRLIAEYSGNKMICSSRKLKKEKASSGQMRLAISK